MHEDRPKVSVVITAHNEQAHIRATLAGLARQGWVVDGRAEVILVDDRSTDATLAEARSAGLAGLRILHTHDIPGKSDRGLTKRQLALDLGFRAAGGAVILTLDADSLLPSGWIEQMALPILNGQVDAQAGPIGFLPLLRPIAMWQSGDTAYYLEVASLIAGLEQPSGVFFGNFAFRADLYGQLGGFDRIGPALTEDLAFARAIGLSGRRIGYVGAAARVDVQAAPDLPALIERTVRITRGPFSMLAAVLTVWPISLVLLTLGMGIWGPWPVMLRYGAGVGFQWWALWRRHPDPRLFLAALIHEPLVIGLAIAVALRIARRRGITWGGARYD